VIELYRRGKRVPWVKVGEYGGWNPNTKHAVSKLLAKDEDVRVIEHSYWMRELIKITKSNTPYFAHIIIDSVKRECGQSWSNVRPLNWD
jgi:hypothetical protein